jgi:ribonuclease HII
LSIDETSFFPYNSLKIRMNGKTWRNLKEEKADEIKTFLLKAGGKEETRKNPSEVWRIRLPDALFTYYQNRTLYIAHGPSEKNLLPIYQKMEEIAGPRYSSPDREMLFGLDETGKGEIIGPVILAGVSFPKELFPTIDKIVGLSDTKRPHKFPYWENIFKQLSSLKVKGFAYFVEEISPDKLRKENLNRLLDKGYKKIINIFLKGMGEEKRLKEYRIVLDDYGIGKNFRRFLQCLQEKGAEVIVVKSADSEYLEVKTAAILAKRFRERIIKKIKENPKYQIAGLTIGSGNLSDKETKEWLRKWKEVYKNFPYFVKQSFKIRI